MYRPKAKFWSSSKVYDTHHDSIKRYWYFHYYKYIETREIQLTFEARYVILSAEDQHCNITDYYPVY